MQAYKIRLKNRLLQLLYKPQPPKAPANQETLTFLDELEQQLEEKITPLLKELFE